MGVRQIDYILITGTKGDMQSPSEIIGTTAKNDVVPDATSNEQPI